MVNMWDLLNINNEKDKHNFSFHIVTWQRGSKYNTMINELHYKGWTREYIILSLKSLWLFMWQIIIHIECELLKMERTDFKLGSSIKSLTLHEEMYISNQWGLFIFWAVCILVGTYRYMFKQTQIRYFVLQVHNTKLYFLITIFLCIQEWNSPYTYTKKGNTQPISNGRLCVDNFGPQQPHTYSDRTVKFKTCEDNESTAAA